MPDNPMRVLVWLEYKGDADPWVSLRKWLSVTKRYRHFNAGEVRLCPDVAALAARAVEVRPVSGEGTHELYLVGPDGSQAYLASEGLGRAAEGLAKSYRGVVEAILKALLSEIAGSKP